MFKNMISVFLLSLLALSICGCVPLLLAGGVAGGAGAQGWISGKLVNDVDASFEAAASASESALVALGFDITSKIKKTNVAQFKSRYTNGESIWVDVHKMSESISRIQVRVGAVPDKEASVEIMDKIMEYL
ncbi:DUF3568 family protein [Candidatus Omnitrophota bacterium]